MVKLTSQLGPGSDWNPLAEIEKNSFIIFPQLLFQIIIKHEVFLILLQVSKKQNPPENKQNDNINWKVK